MPLPPTPPAPVAPPPAPPPTPKSPPPVAAAAPPEAGDRPCPQCGLANSADRRFCARCAAVLVAPARGPGPKSSAGSRPGAPFDAGSPTLGGDGAGLAVRFRAMSRASQAIIAAVGLAAVALGITFGSELGSLRQRLFPRPAYITASDHKGPDGLVDGSPEKVWVAKGPPPISEVVTFDAPVDLFKVGVLSGASADPAEFAKGPRPRRVRLTARSTDGRTHTTIRELADSPAFQSFSLGARKVATVEVVVESTYGQASSGARAAIRELEFFRRN